MSKTTADLVRGNERLARRRHHSQGVVFLGILVVCQLPAGWFVGGLVALALRSAAALWLKRTWLEDRKPGGTES
jgi:hypothetical protein